MRKEKIRITRRDELGQTLAAYLAQNAGQYQCHLHIVEGDNRFNVKSVMAMMAVPLAPGKMITIEADGPDEYEALEGIRRYLEEY